MEIERKFIINHIPFSLDKYNKHIISQGYLSTDPVLRIRQSDDHFFLTIKSRGLTERIEVEKEITSDEYKELSSIVKGNVISKTRYLIPDGEYTIELDVFQESFEGLIYAEVEFPDIESASNYKIPEYFGREVTEEGKYQNSSLSNMKKEDIPEFIRNAIQ